MPEWIDAMFGLLWKHCLLAQSEAWEMVPTKADAEIEVTGAWQQQQQRRRRRTAWLFL